MLADIEDVKKKLKAAERRANYWEKECKKYARQTADPPAWATADEGDSQAGEAAQALEVLGGAASRVTDSVSK